MFLMPKQSEDRDELASNPIWHKLLDLSENPPASVLHPYAREAWRQAILRRQVEGWPGFDLLLLETVCNELAKAQEASDMANIEPFIWSNGKKYKSGHSQVARHHTSRARVFARMLRLTNNVSTTKKGRGRQIAIHKETLAHEKSKMLDAPAAATAPSDTSTMFIPIG